MRKKIETQISNVCGSCAGAPVCAEGVTFAHEHCSTRFGHQCDCADLLHRPNSEIMRVMARYCHMSVVEAEERLQRRSSPKKRKSAEVRQVSSNISRVRRRRV